MTPLERLEAHRRGFPNITRWRINRAGKRAAAESRRARYLRETGREEDNTPRTFAARLAALEAELWRRLR